MRRWENTQKRLHEADGESLEAPGSDWDRCGGDLGDGGGRAFSTSFLYNLS